MSNQNNVIDSQLIDEKMQSASGGCLCGKLRYIIRGGKRDVILCHCENCRRAHGHVAAYIATNRSQIEIISQDSLRWFHDESPDTFRGFCGNCGSSLFWCLSHDSEKISVSAGSLDDSCDLKTLGHIFLKEKGGYYEISDGLPGFSEGSNGELG